MQKHRGSSKFSVHGWVGGLSAKQSSHNPEGHSLKVKFDNRRNGGQSSKASTDNFIVDPGMLLILLMCYRWRSYMRYNRNCISFVIIVCDFTALGRFKGQKFLS